MHVTLVFYTCCMLVECHLFYFSWSIYGGGTSETLVKRVHFTQYGNLRKVHIPQFKCLSTIYIIIKMYALCYCAVCIITKVLHQFNQLQYKSFICMGYVYWYMTH